MYKYRWHIFGLTLNFPLKISTIVRKDHAKMEEIAQMLWMIITVAVFLASRGRIAVLVSHFRPFYLIVYFTECMIFIKSSPCFIISEHLFPLIFRIIHCFAPCKWCTWIQDSLGFLIPGTGFQIFVSGTGILDSSRLWDSGILKLYSGFQIPGFRIPRATISQKPDSRKGN